MARLPLPVPAAARWSLAVTLPAVLAALAGCSGSDGPVPVHPVSGSVVYAGQPAPGVQVYFVPTSAPMVPQVPQNPSAVTDERGRFRLGTYQPGDGAAAGGYQVVLLWPQGRAAAEEEGSSEDRLLGWYDAMRSPLTAQVQPGPNELPPFRLPAVTRPPEALPGIPGRN